MTKSEELFFQIAKDLKDGKLSKMFGCDCIKAPNGKAVCMMWQNELVFKMESDYEKEAMKLKGVHVFSPMEGRTMGGWIQVPFSHSKRWMEFAKRSMQIVKKIKVEKKGVAKKLVKKNN
ncbi:MAG: hypothetical protein ACKVPJ_06765 [Chitinophagales bacterium]